MTDRDDAAAGRSALLIIDMVKDNFVESRKLPVTEHARRIIGPLNRIIRHFHDRGRPVVFSTDAFHRDDFIFRGRMEPHSLAGTEGAEVVEELDRGPGDLWVPKPRFSAFFRTGLELRLREAGVDTCVVGGIATNFCVLTTALDALCHDFRAVLLEDASAAASPEIHAKTLDVYRRNPLFPLFRTARTDEVTADLP